MKLHQSLAALARDHGHSLFRDASAFRGSLDDYLDEGQASSGTINLLTDAVRLGALDGMLTMLDSGAAPQDAVESAGQRLARDRGSADVRGCQWAVAVLGFALGRVPEPLVTGLDPEASTAAPPHHGPGGTTPHQPPMPPPMQSPVQSPPHQPMMSPVGPPQPPIQSPPHQPPHAPYGGWAPPPQKKSRTGLIIAAVAVAVLLLVGGVIGVVALAGDGDSDDPTADPTSQTTATTEATEPTETTDLGGPTIEGTGYSVQFPEGWTDNTAEFQAQNPDERTLDRIILWGDTMNTARGNVIVETQSSFGSTDPNDLKDRWQQALVSSDPTAELTEIPNIAIDGQTALGVEILRTNANDVKIKQRAHLVISGDKGYSITASLQEGDDAVLTAFDEVLSTWSWTE